MKGLRKWNNNLAQIINNKKEAFKRHLSTETQAENSNKTGVGP
jgi:hypothetical protein